MKNVAWRGPSRGAAICRRDLNAASSALCLFVARKFAAVPKRCPLSTGGARAAMNAWAAGLISSVAPRF
jgi:hypothetical protein